MSFYLWIIFFIGLSVGSFLNVLIDRLPVGKDVVRGRSHCDHCKRSLSWFELVPLVSWILQGGKSRCCHKRISIQYPLIELVTAIGFMVIYRVISLSSPIVFLSSFLLFCSFLVIFVVDLKTELIPVEMLYAAGVGVVLRLLPLVTVCISNQDAMCGHLIFQYFVPAGISAGFFFFLWYSSKGKAMGDGDIPLAFLIGLVLGYPKLIIGFYAAFLTGAAVGVILILRGVRTMKSHIPFGPFLILGMGVALTYSQPILEWWSTLW